jgi:putative CocE/NonD family hydrolase
VDLRPDGRAMSVTDGIVRARYRNGGKPEFLTPGEVTEVTIQCCPTAYSFGAGHRMRLEIAGSNFPAFSVNAQTGEDIATGTRQVVAQLQVHHSAEHPSRIILPVIR